MGKEVYFMSLLSSSPSLLSVILGFISGDEREDKVRRSIQSSMDFSFSFALSPVLED